MTPGLSVIIDAIKEGRRIIQRMNSYAIYRIAETLRVLLFITLAHIFRGLCMSDHYRSGAPPFVATKVQPRGPKHQFTIPLPRCASWAATTPT